ncbi:MAG: ribbon-helix-helix protein, CopG family [Deltaproteobacteria bacterium]|jgi:metal-responsive CopG/Arc/MetJ family transcriptional regulator|nr:ribbon-helix-helix protein, CopG family [Deltaproteobacteria bacterium]
MKTTQMTIGEPLLDEVEEVIQDLKTTRSAFIRAALQLALRRHAISKLEQQHAEGYAKHPITPAEFDIWESEQPRGEP